MLRQIAAPWRSLPTRALAAKKKKPKQQKKAGEAVEHKMVPYLPPELVKETKHFFEETPKMKALLELVFSPLDPKETEDDRLEYEEAKAEFDRLTARARAIYEAHERQANERIWKAVRQLPEDLHDEAIASKPEKVPNQLLFHNRYGREIFDSLHDDERRKLQAYHNLMYVRYPHVEEKARNPQRFLIPENQVVSRQKEAALAKRKIKTR
eukprot:TRINITY_DN23905_c0_g1_i1.p1 TRINITY_DN23905_c0_g1~~TRINITY_DN23905_c0_g1_i1.p1  ORF type:complete len:210 (-),score=52.57 TRINITY_DN23905_c0_g1_i1:164-793(-)